MKDLIQKNSPKEKCSRTSTNGLLSTTATSLQRPLPQSPRWPLWRCSKKSSKHRIVMVIQALQRLTYRKPKWQEHNPPPPHTHTHARTCTCTLRIACKYPKDMLMLLNAMIYNLIYKCFQTYFICKHRFFKELQIKEECTLPCCIP